ncbi:MAG: type II toxin-antitoxin system HicB family antitoxin [Deltaproteobacteria bacterium]|nr:type II toxin-antitoxin system HicB family antitoxin [Deltaproteobacteria bacterium]
MERYRVLLRREAEAFVALVPELGRLSARGETRAEALAAVEQEIAAALENMAEQGEKPPVPVDEAAYDGALNLQVSADLHRDLDFAAKEAGIATEDYAAELLARALPLRRHGGGRSTRHPDGDRDQGRRRGRGPQGSRYRDIMDNRADFIEYVRGLDGGGGGAGAGAGGRGRRGRRGGDDNR